ncbi:MAG: hypothetical protein COT92_02370 [Candidatus Doudnabacteria bacterium CG10_big_fil_rev_8_21_14_0_10_42_18]|uniref:Uncharacterized protein n=1 Tax=Candidatus Doudnabacteria bacterium CG10_big_fil_rev_8_21_14_0_10_42_18 TaxID=1974552 RepID=A0A2H0VD13_9BACT|nr:MAG: hypothetical protein COT92_02370 [Candidatus Doudnabacteria bacterium CG10_big_fil_rev_8_21_14_0_10_42_18]
MKALFALKSGLKNGLIIATIVSLTALVYPEIILASNSRASEASALVFEVKNPIQNQNSLSFNEIMANDPLAIKLQEYLESLGSPLAPYSADIIQEPQWQRALAISWVESNMCKRHVDNNCSGIGVAPGHPLWRKYSTHLDWFKDMSNLLEKPIYKEKYTTFQAMRGVYVQPGSANWVYGAQAKYNALMAITEEAENERQYASVQIPLKAALATFPQLAYLD